MDAITEQAKTLIDELKDLMPRTDAASARRRDEICSWIKEHRTPEVTELFNDFMDDGLAAIETEVDTLRRQIEDKDYRLLPIGVIAEEYFGKSSSWLSQRLNGTKVRGKVYTLNDEQKATFNRAVKEIGRRIGSFRIA